MVLSTLLLVSSTIDTKKYQMEMIGSCRGQIGRKLTGTSTIERTVDNAIDSAIDGAIDSTTDGAVDGAANITIDSTSDSTISLNYCE